MLSVVIYHEPLSTRRISVLLLIVLSLALLWWDRKQDMDKAQTGDMLPVPGSIGKVD